MLPEPDQPVTFTVDGEHVTVNVPDSHVGRVLTWLSPAGTLQKSTLTGTWTVPAVEAPNVLLGLRAAGIPARAPMNATRATHQVLISSDGTNPAQLTAYVGVKHRHLITDLLKIRSVARPKNLTGGVRWPATLNDLPVVAVTGPAANIIRTFTNASEPVPFEVIDPAAQQIVAAYTAPLVTVEGLRRYQCEALTRMEATSTGIVNLCAPGLGKTVMTLAYLGRNLNEGQVALVACPGTVRYQWQTEAARWAPGLDVHVVTSSDALRTALAPEPGDCRPRLVITTIVLAASNAEDLNPVDVLIVDEGAFLAGTGRRARQLFKYRRRCGYATVLSGSPSTLNTDSFVSLCKFVVPAATFTVPDGHNETLTDETVDLVAGPVVFRRSRAAVSDELPQVTFTTVPVDPVDPTRVAELTRRLTGLVAELDDCSSPAAAARAAKAPFVIRQTLAELARTTAMGRGSHVAQLVEGVGQPTVVFTDSLQVLDDIVDACETRDLPVLTVTGSTKNTDLTGFLSRPGPAVMVISGAGSHGLNLQAASAVCFADVPAAADLWVQRVARVARLGAVTDSIQVFVLTAPGFEADLVGSLTGPVSRVLSGADVNVTDPVQVTRSLLTSEPRDAVPTS